MLEKLYKVFLVEDDYSMSDAVKTLLEKWGFKVFICDDYENVLNTFKEINPHIIIMDINIPYKDGFYWCKEIRKLSNVPILFISSRDSNMDVIMGINNGGDDYIQKPFDSSILIAKIQAIIRRCYEYKISENYIIKCNNVLLNINNYNVHFKEQCITLTTNEFKILKILMENRGQVISRSKLMKKLWNDDIYVNENTLTVNINRLRKSLESIGIINFIITKKGMGYIVL